MCEALKSQPLRHALALVLAILVGIVVGAAWLRPQPHPSPPPVAIATPSPSASTPAAVAQVATHTHVVIERPIYQPPADTGPAGLVSGQGQGVNATPSPAIERIVIDTDGTASATAPVVTPAPVVVSVAQQNERLPIGVTVGLFPGNMALDWRVAQLEPARYVDLSGLEGLHLGASIILNTRLVGVGGNVSLDRLSPYLYLGVGMYQEFKLMPDPRPWVGLGLRF